MHWHFLFYLTVQQQVLVLGFSTLAWMGIGIWLGVYDKLDSWNPRTIFRDSVNQCAYGTLCLLVFEYALRTDLSRFFLVAYGSLTGLFMLLFRLTAGRVRQTIRRDFATPRYVMVVGTGERAIGIARALEEAKAQGVRLAGFFTDSTDCSHEIALESIYKVYALSEIESILSQYVVDEIVFAVDSGSLGDLEKVFLLCDQEGVRTHVAVDFFPHVNSKISLVLLGDIPLLTFTATPHDEIRLLIKRATDVAIAAASLVVLAPFMAIVAILIKITSPGPVLFRQVRCGLNGRQFLLYKFRSMCQDAEERKASVAHLNTRATAFKIPGDPRVTPLGRCLRKFSIDEWPQLWNVLRGDMSLVGPRPAIPTEVRVYEVWQRRRLRMRPGITSLWAVSGRDEVDFETWMKLDMQYIDSWSLALDWKILLYTIPRTLTGRGAS
jgi:exopolysaccharide biosynthesis polyprenyl glycosylphosphotransferase